MRPHALATLVLIAAVATTGSARSEESASVYDLEAELVDQEDRAVGLDVHRGRPTVISMFYAKCPHACPALIADINRIDAGLSKKARKRTRYLLVSLDPTDETKTFRDLIEMHGLDPKRWELTRTDERTVRRVAAVLGIQYRQLPDGSWNHSSVITVLDEGGRPLHAVEGLAREHADTIEILETAAAPGKL